MPSSTVGNQRTISYLYDIIVIFSITIDMQEHSVVESAFHVNFSPHLYKKLWYKTPVSRPFVRKDRFYFKAKEEGYPARSAYKLMELDDRFQIFKRGRRVIDLGCAPGGWLKVGLERLGDKGTLIGIDLLPIKISPNPNLHYIAGDFLDEENQNKILELARGKVDWVLSDLSPNISGIKFRDEFQSYELCKMALEFALKVLKIGGGFLFKVFPGSELEDFRRELKTHFKKITTVLPEATRKSSTEIYIVCQERKITPAGAVSGACP